MPIHCWTMNSHMSPEESARYVHSQDETDSLRLQKQTRSAANEIIPCGPAPACHRVLALGTA